MAAYFVLDTVFSLFALYLAAKKCYFHYTYHHTFASTLRQCGFSTRHMLRYATINFK